MRRADSSESTWRVSTAPRVVPSMTPKILTAGARLGSYEVRPIRGAGAMADVYQALDLAKGREVALKVLAPNPGTPERLRRRFAAVRPYFLPISSTDRSSYQTALRAHSRMASRSAAWRVIPLALARRSRSAQILSGNRTERGVVLPASRTRFGRPRPTWTTRRSAAIRRAQGFRFPRRLRRSHAG